MSQLYTDLVELETMDATQMSEIVGGRKGADDPVGGNKNKQKGKSKGKKKGGADDGPNHT